MNNLHKIILDKLNKASKKTDPDFNIQRYLGTTHPFSGISNGVQKSIAKDFYKENSGISFDEFINLLNSLNRGETFSEKTIGPMLIPFYKTYQSLITPEHLDKWLENLEGWAEIDSLCQSTFHSKTLLNNWKMSNQALDKFSIDKNINKRRASLVLLCKSLRESNDTRLKKRAFENVERLKYEKHILITKAISWVLREMTKNFKKDVAKYLQQNADSLPKIAVRETQKKLTTGKKN